MPRSARRPDRRAGSPARPTAGCPRPAPGAVPRAAARARGSSPRTPRRRPPGCSVLNPARRARVQLVPVRAGLLTLIALLAALWPAAPADAVYGRDGAYLDYATTVPLGEHGKLPIAVYPFGRYYTPVTIAQYGLQAAANYSVRGRRVDRADALLAADWLVRHPRDNGAPLYRFPLTVRGLPLPLHSQRLPAAEAQLGLCDGPGPGDVAALARPPAEAASRVPASRPAR